MVYNKSPLLAAAKWTLFLLIFTPFLIDASVFFPYIEGKTVFLRAVATLSLLFLTLFLLFAKWQEKEMFLKLKMKLLKSPISLFVALFLMSATISTIFAKDSYRAFFGDVERGEGLVGYIFFAAIFYLALLLFERQEWGLFFWAVVFSGVVFFTSQIVQLNQSHWTDRPFATFGNPSYLAGYFLFVIFSALILLSETWTKRRMDTDKNANHYVPVFVFAFLGTVIFVSGVGIFLTQTRGTLLGVAAGVFASLLYGGVRFLLEKFPKAKFQITIAALLLVLMTVGSTVFVFQQLLSGRETTEVMREFQFLPANLAERFLGSGSFQTRLIAARVSIKSILPANEGFGRFLFGWGPENYKIAYNTHFDPNYFRYEEVWFDRAHNRVLDALVMEGIVGLLVFLGLWCAVLLTAFRMPGVLPQQKGGEVNKRKYQEPQREGFITKGFLDGTSFIFPSAFIFFVVSYFVHDLFLFDNPSASVAIFMFFAFAAYQSGAQRGTRTDQDKNKGQRVPLFTSVLMSVIAIAAIILFFWTTWGPYMQMKSYIKLKISNITIREFTEKLDSVFEPYTYVQERIRTDLIKSLPAFRSDEGIGTLAAKSFEAMDELIKREPYEPRFPMNMAQTLEEIGNIQLWQKAEEYWRKSLALVPNRPDLIYSLGHNLLVQGKFDEGKEVLDRLLVVAPDVPTARFLYSIAFGSVLDKYPEKKDLLIFSFENLENVLDNPGLNLDAQKLDMARELYQVYTYRFYLARDEQNFLKALQRSKELEEQWEKIQEEAFLQGKIKELPWKDESEKRSKQIQRALEAFPTRGWEAIGIQK
jgi:O-antigen ligase/tetratricopeptide (TPR) repeat protein